MVVSGSGSDPTALRIALLGPVEARRGDALVPLGGTKQKTLLAVLALDPGRVIGVDRLISALWGEQEPATALNALQVYASNLRRALGELDNTSVLRWHKPGYLIDLAPDATDVGRFQTFVAQARELTRAQDLSGASRLFGLALAEWRGPALADVADEPFAANETARLESLRLAAMEDLFEVDLGLGRHAELIGPLQQVVFEQPLREKTRAMLMLALYRCGRQAEALETFREARTLLADELGLDPGPELRDLERAILAQSPELNLRSTASSIGRWDPTIRTRPGSATANAWLESEGGVRVALDQDRLLMGRAEDCDVVVADGRASRRHALIRTTGSEHEIIDLGSTNGTRVNAAELLPNQPHRLRDGDLIWVGGAQFDYVRPAAAQAPTESATRVE